MYTYSISCREYNHSLLDHAHLRGLKGDTYVNDRSRTSAGASIGRFFYRVGSCCKRGGGAHGKNSISLLDDVYGLPPITHTLLHDLRVQLLCGLRKADDRGNVA